MSVMGVQGKVKSFAQLTVKAKPFAFGEIETYGFGKMKSVPTPTKSD